jgi:C-terminal processing protease CtpA/Prc
MRFLYGARSPKCTSADFVGDNFSQRFETTFETLKQKQNKVLILDLRGNGGGEDKYVALFLGISIT